MKLYVLRIATNVMSNDQRKVLRGWAPGVYVEVAMPSVEDAIGGPRFNSMRPVPSVKYATFYTDEEEARDAARRYTPIGIEVEVVMFLSRALKKTETRR